MGDALRAWHELTGLEQIGLFILAMVAIHMIGRAIMVGIRGWPPEHLDADGDTKE